MRKLAVTLALASTALGTPALARDDARYARVESRAMLVEDIDYDTGAVDNATTVDQRPGPLPPSPEMVCIPGPYIVFFDWDKYDVTPEAASILDNAITNYQGCGNAPVMVAGYTDTSGPADYNMTLSQRRADSVKAYFTGRGIPEDSIKTEAFGETHLRVQTGNNVREPQNRRVEITYGTGPGN